MLDLLEEYEEVLYPKLPTKFKFVHKKHYSEETQEIFPNATIYTAEIDNLNVIITWMKIYTYGNREEKLDYSLSDAQKYIQCRTWIII